MVLVYQNGKFFATKKRANGPRVAYLKESKNATKIWANGPSILEWKIFATKKGANSLSIAFLEKFKNATKIWANGLSMLEWNLFLLPKKGLIVLALHF